MIASKLIRRAGDDFQVYLQLRKKEIITVVLDTDHDVHYFAVNSMRWACHSRTTRISEVEDAGKLTDKRACGCVLASVSPNHSYRNALNGSKREARAAGKYPASSATLPRAATAATTDRGSKG